MGLNPDWEGWVNLLPLRLSGKGCWRQDKIWVQRGQFKMCDGCTSVGLCNTTTLQSCVGSSHCLSGEMQGIVIIHKALHSTGLGYLRDRLFPKISVCPTYLSGCALDPFLKQSHLMGPKRCAIFCCAVCKSFQISSGIELTPTLLAFRKAAKTWLFLQPFFRAEIIAFPIGKGIELGFLGCLDFNRVLILFYNVLCIT